MTVAIVRALARTLLWLAAAALVAMVIANVLDVGLRNGFDFAVFGTHEVVELCLAAVAFLAIPEVFLRDDHITVELIDQVVPQRVIAGLRVFGALLSVVFLVVLSWRMVRPALDFVAFNEVSFDLGIPRIVPASLILAGVVVAACAALMTFAHELRRLRRDETE